MVNFDQTFFRLRKYDFPGGGDFHPPHRLTQDGKRHSPGGVNAEKFDFEAALNRKKSGDFRLFWTKNAYFPPKRMKIPSKVFI